MRIFKNAWFVRFARVRKISGDALREAVREPKAGRWMPTRAGAWSSNEWRPGQGKSKGYRAKLREGENEPFRKTAKHVSGLSDTQLNILIGKGQFEEVESDGEEVSK